MKIFIDTDEKLRKHWKILRDTQKRGYSIEKILNQIETREKDSQKYIQHQKDYADITINLFPLHDFTLGDSHIDIQLGLKLILISEISIESLAVELEENNAVVEWNYMEDLKRQYLIFHKPLNMKLLETLSQKYLYDLEDIIHKTSITWERGYNGTIEFFILLAMTYKIKEGVNESNIL